MDKGYIDILKETFSDPTLLSPDKVKALMDETLKVFKEIRNKFASADPKEREEAMSTSMEIKQALEVQMDQLSKQLGIDPSQFLAMAENTPSNLSGAESAIVDDIKNRFRSFNSEVEKPKTADASRKKRTPKVKLMG